MQETSWCMLRRFIQILFSNYGKVRILSLSCKTPAIQKKQTKTKTIDTTTRCIKSVPVSEIAFRSLFFQ